MSSLRLRAADRDDAELLWKWSNDEATRVASFRSDPIPWDTHCQWLDRKLASNDSRIWIAESDSQPVGQVRYDRLSNEAEIDISVAASFRGQGLGTAILTLSAPRACCELGLNKLVAIVKSSNHASLTAFEHAGFRLVEKVTRFGQSCVRFELVCSRVEE